MSILFLGQREGEKAKGTGTTLFSFVPVPFGVAVYGVIFLYNLSAWILEWPSESRRAQVE
jgi:hypothetical protein